MGERWPQKPFALWAVVTLTLSQEPHGRPFLRQKVHPRLIMFRGGFICARNAIPRPGVRKTASRCLVTTRPAFRLPRVGDRLHGFTVQRATEVPELELAAVQLQHDKTGAEYVHVARDDKNNLFAIGFKTNPPNDTGVPHILEHIALCGSEKYPVRDPFFKMLNRSLSNFMNAFTSADHTIYPFATTNTADFYNLMDVYLDATLHPLLKAEDFKQEGWRIGPVDPHDPASPLAFKGVVYNEMKGQMSDSSYLYLIRFRDNIFPSLRNSGGDPQKITNLTVDQLRAFHKANYTPSNSKIFTYGDMPVEEHLRRLDAILSPLSKASIVRELREPLKIDGPKLVTVGGPFDPLMDKDVQHKTSVSWIMNDTSNIVETFALKLLSAYLLDGYGSPMYKGLIDAQLGSDFSPNTGFDTSAKRGIFSVGLQNVRPEDVTRTQEAIVRVLQDVHHKGFESRKIEGILHQLELALKHKSAKFGMAIMQSITPAWFNGTGPFDTIEWEKTVVEFRKLYSRRGYLEGLLEKYLISPNTFTFTMEPEISYGQELATEEDSRLQQKISGVGEESASLREQEIALLDIQEKARTQNLDCLPTLSLEDIARNVVRKELRKSQIGNVPTQWRIAPTNGLTYFKAVNSLEGLSEDLRLYLPLFAEAVLRLGTVEHSMEFLEDEIKLKTGGISADTHISTNPSSLEVSEEGLVFSGHCLDKNVPHLLELLKTVLLETNFAAISKLRTLIHGIASGFANSLAENGHGFARTFAAAPFTPAARASEVLGGMTQVRLISNLAANEIYNEALDKLKDIARFAARQNGLRVAITCAPDAMSANETAVGKFIESLPTSEVPIRDIATFDFGTPAKALFPMPFQVSYTAMCLKTVPYTHKDGAALQILSQLLTYKYLHREIREKGGAYGGGAFHRDTDGIFGFYSYRDPNVLNTLRVVEEAGNFALNNAWTERDLDEAKLSVFQAVDAPQSVSDEGMANFLSGITDEMRQTRRGQLLDVGINDVRNAASRYLIQQIQAEQTATAVLGEQKEWLDESWNIFPLSLENEPKSLTEKIVL